MSTPTNDGGPVFPQDIVIRHPNGESAVLRHIGMSLRDWFAGQALVALPHMGCGCDLENDELAAAAYQIADAMLAERAKGGVK